MAKYLGEGTSQGASDKNPVLRLFLWRMTDSVAPLRRFVSFALVEPTYNRACFTKSLIYKYIPDTDVMSKGQGLASKVQLCRLTWFLTLELSN